MKRVSAVLFMFAGVVFAGEQVVRLVPPRNGFEVFSFAVGLGFLAAGVALWLPRARGPR